MKNGINRLNIQLPTGICFNPNKLIPTPTSKTPPIPAIESATTWSIDPPRPNAHNVKNP